MVRTGRQDIFRIIKVELVIAHLRTLFLKAKTPVGFGRGEVRSRFRAINVVPGGNKRHSETSKMNATEVPPEQVAKFGNGQFRDVKWIGSFVTIADWFVGRRNEKRAARRENSPNFLEAR